MRMTKTPYRLGLDIGSTTVKAVVLDRDIVTNITLNEGIYIFPMLNLPANLVYA